MKKRIVSFLMCLALVLTLGGGLWLTAFTLDAEAAEITSYDYTSIEDDLSGIDLSCYAANPLGDCEIIYFMEYCYSEKAKYNDYYGLYVYVYNPTQESIVTANGYNSISLATSYDKNGEAEVYEPFNLVYLDKMDNNRFYKFKVSGSETLLDMAQAYALLNNGIRRYEAIELQVRHGTEYSSSTIAKAYEFSGYSAYCGLDSSPIDSLECKDYGVRSIHLELTSTNYRFATDSYICDELNSVFFTVPEAYFQDFGNLNNINAEWYEYKTNYIFVTSNKDAYSSLWDARGIVILENGYPANEEDKKYQELPEGVAGPPTPLYATDYRVLWEDIYQCPILIDDSYYSGHYYAKSYAPFIINDYCDEADEFSRLKPDKNHFVVIDKEHRTSSIDCFHWLFYSADAIGADAYRVSKEEVEKYMRKYTNDFPEQERIRDKYASSLFVESIDEDRLDFLEKKDDKCGYVNMTFTAGEDFDEYVGNSFVDADSTQTAWNEFWFGTKYKPYSYSPIVTIKEGDLVLDADAFSKKYYVNKYDAEKIIKNAKAAYDNEERPVLLRFAVTDYYASTARFDYVESDGLDMSGENGYVAEETVFLDFDVISLGFKSKNGYTDTVIGVVAEPIDIINGLTPPDDLVEDEEWWQKIIMMLGLILIVVVILAFSGPLTFVFNLLFTGIKIIATLLINVLTLPFRLIFSLFKRR